MLHEQCAEPDWTRVHTDDFKILDKAEAGVYSKLFSQCHPVGNFMSNFDA